MNDSYQRIEAYLLGQLSEAEQHAFKVELKTDKNLAASFIKQQQEHKMMEFLIEQDLRGKVSNWLEEANTEEVTQENTNFRYRLSKRQWWIIGIAAIICVLLLYFLTTLASANPVNEGQQIPEIPTVPKQELEETEIPSLQDEQEEENKPPSRKSSRPIAKTEPSASKPDYLALAMDFADPINFDELYQTRSSEGVDSLDLALRNLKGTQFESSIAFLQSIPTDDPRFIDAQYFMGLALFQNRQLDRAIPSLKIVAAESFYLDAPTAEWYLLLAYLQQGQIEDCQKILDRIVAIREEDPSNSPIYFEEAKRLNLSLKALAK